MAGRVCRSTLRVRRRLREAVGARVATAVTAAATVSAHRCPYVLNVNPRYYFSNYRVLTSLNWTNHLSFMNYTTLAIKS